MRSTAPHGPQVGQHDAASSHYLRRTSLDVFQGGAYEHKVNVGCRVAGATRRSAAHGEVSPADCQPLDRARTPLSGVPPETFDAHRTCPAVSRGRLSAAGAPTLRPASSS